MTYRDSSVATSYDSAPYVSDVSPDTIRSPRPRAPKARRPDYRATNRPATERRQGLILRLLALAPVGFTVSDIGRALGCSRQLALYHVKKLAAAGRLTMILEPCERNGGLQFAVWDSAALARHFARTVREAA